MRKLLLALLLSGSILAGTVVPAFAAGAGTGGSTVTDPTVCRDSRGGGGAGAGGSINGGGAGDGGGGSDVVCGGAGGGGGTAGP